MQCRIFSRKIEEFHKKDSVNILAHTFARKYPQCMFSNKTKIAILREAN